MRVWLLQGRQGEDGSGLEPLLQRWAGHAENGAWQVDVRPANAALVGDVRLHQPDVLVLAEAVCPAGPWIEEVLALDTSLVVAAAPPRVEGYRALAERYPVLLVPAPPCPDTLGLAVLSAQAARRRRLLARAQLEQLQQRLNDRIVIERAKGVLVQRLGIAEEEAYRRLRVLSRRQRRQIRDIAQSLLDTQALLLPEANGLFEEPQANGRGGPGIGNET